MTEELKTQCIDLLESLKDNVQQNAQKLQSIDSMLAKLRAVVPEAPPVVVEAVAEPVEAEDVPAPQEADEPREISRSKEDADIGLQEQLKAEELHLTSKGLKKKR